MPIFSTLHILNINNSNLHRSKVHNNWQLTHSHVCKCRWPEDGEITTFFHTCSKIPNVPKGKKGKDSTWPTPQQKFNFKKKNQYLILFNALSEKEKDFLNTYLHILEARAVPATVVNPFWNECVNKLNKYCGVMCLSMYQKVKNIFPVGVAQEIETDTFSFIKETH
ncbi:hypothetical protein ACJMK2_014017 [Sinanodonta woodiana]|uniref:Uncharacterized protein n=1 Tax=Sinanodonta woodiana TaxID=1069815 RepID=A0ABD3V1U9_SINWO